MPATVDEILFTIERRGAIEGHTTRRVTDSEVQPEQAPHSISVQMIEWLEQKWHGIYAVHVGEVRGHDVEDPSRLPK